MIPTAPGNGRSRLERRTARSTRPSGLLPILLAAACLGSLAGTGAAPSPLRTGTATLSVTLSADPSSGPAPLLVDFHATTNSTRTIWFAWSFGDGSTVNGSSGSTVSPTHWYGTPGTYDASVEAFDGSAIGRANLTVRVFPTPLLVTIQTSRGSGPAPLLITFTAAPLGGSGTYTTFEWNFGDGGSALGLAVNYTYLRAGAYSASVVVVDSAGTAATAAVHVNATGPGASPGPTLGSIAGGSPWITVLLAAPFITGAAALASWEWSRRRETRAGPEGPDRGAERGEHGSGPAPPSPRTEEVPAAPPRAESWGEDAADTADGIPSPIPLERGPVVGSEPGVTFPPPEIRRVSQRVIVHLGALGVLRPDELPGRARTQSGMSEELGVPTNGLSNILRRLVSAGVLTVETGHARGVDRRVKVYRLTPKGESLAREMRLRAPATSRQEARRDGRVDAPDRSAVRARGEP